MGLNPFKKQIKQSHITVPLSVFFKKKGGQSKFLYLYSTIKVTSTFKIHLF